MTDRELLELAAKAAGNGAHWDDEYQRMQMDYSHKGGTNLEEWNPLTDDGDALRMAVMLRMNVSSWGSGASAIVSAGDDVLLAEPHYGDDPCRATRRAITRAAAEIGRNMP